MKSTYELIQIAMQQSALDINCRREDFLLSENVIVRSGIHALAKKYYEEPITCNLVSYGSNIVASVQDEYRAIIKEYLEKFEFYHCFETPNIHWLEEKMNKYDQSICFMAEYFLPDMQKLRRLSCDYEPKSREISTQNIRGKERRASQERVGRAWKPQKTNVWQGA